MADLELGNEQFVRSLFSWYQEHKRNLPWRQTRDPYKIWVSEIILQQTRIDQGMSYYLRFIEQWPDVQSLAEASEDALMKAWEGLGYYNRARNMHYTAQYISKELNGKFPDSYEGLLSLKGVGPYTAAAIASFAFGRATPVLDGNVYRVLARIFDIDLDTAKSSSRPKFLSLLQNMMQGTDPAVFNNAMMEFGALQCVPSSPNCQQCFYRNHCRARINNTVDQRPVKSKKIKKKTRYLHYFIERGKDTQWIRKRPTGDIWSGLYELPLVETTVKPGTIEDILPPGYTTKRLSPFMTKKHLLTHQVLYIQIWEAEFDPSAMSEQYEKRSIQEIRHLSFPRPLHGIFEKM